MTSKIKVDNINKVSDDSNIINKCGTTITLGASGDSIALASGASQTGFGRTGTVDWQTSSIKTATFTAVNGEGYFCNTAAGEFTVNLPAGSAGAIVSIQDYNNTFDTYPLTVDPNGTEKINGGEAGGSLSLSDEGQGLTLVYIDSTVGWRSIHENEFSTQGVNPAYITATGGTITTVCTNYKVHTFTGPGTFQVTGGNGPLAVADYMVVAGAGGGGIGYASGYCGGGGGAGGFRESKVVATSGCWTASPLAATSSLPLPIATYPITVGGGGAGRAGCSGCGNGPNVIAGGSGSTSTFSTITSAGGGGGGGGGRAADSNALSGGSGGGGAQGTPSPSPAASAGGSGNTPPTNPAQGKDGGNGPTGANNSGGGGGGAICGGTPTSTPCQGGPGGAGATSSINASPVIRAGGGGGGGNTTLGTGGPGGGGNGGRDTSPGCSSGVAGTVNTGGGGGGGTRYSRSHGGAGGSGIVIIRYRFQ